MQGAQLHRSTTTAPSPAEPSGPKSASRTRGPTVGNARPRRALHHTSVVTPEAVLLEFRTAGVGSRVLAKVVDAFIQFMILTVGAAPIGLLAGGSPVLGAILVGVLGFLVLFGYPASEAFMSGQTVGKKMLGIRVVTTEGGPEQFRHAAIRTLIWWIELIVIPGGTLALIAALVSRRSQRIGDMAAGTVVVRLERRLPQPVFFPIVYGHERFSEQFDAGGMTSDQFAVLRDYMLRYRHLSTGAASHLARGLAESLQRAGATARPGHMSYEHYLMAAVFAYQQRFTFADGSAQAPILPQLATEYGVGYSTVAPPPPGNRGNGPSNIELGSSSRLPPPPSPPSGPPTPPAPGPATPSR